MDKVLHERIMANICVSKAKECWLWKKPYYAAQPYPQIVYKGKKQKISRLLFSMLKRKLKKGECVMHTCDRPNCCNPSHLKAGTHYENMQDRKRKNRGGDRKGEKNGRCKITEKQAKLILSSDKSGSYFAKKHGVSKTAISRLRMGKNWKHLHGGI